MCFARALEVEVKQLKENVYIYQENLKCKDEMVIALTNRLSDLEQLVDISDAQQMSPSQASSLQQFSPSITTVDISTKTKQELEHLQVCNLF